MTVNCLDLPQTAIIPAIHEAPAIHGGKAGRYPRWAIFEHSGVNSWLVGGSSSDPLASYKREQAQQLLRVEQAKAATAARLSELKLEAIRTDNLVSLSSLDDLQDALRSIAFTHRPSIFLLENGNFRVMWKNAAREQVAIQFLGDKNTQFVIFAQDARGVMTRLAGVTTLDRIGAQIVAKANNLLS